MLCVLGILLYQGCLSNRLSQKLKYQTRRCCIPSCEEFRTGYESYKRENKGPIYFDALNIITENWGNAEEMAKGINRIVRGWNRFYAKFDFDSLVKCIEINFAELNRFKNRDIATLSDDDTDTIK